MATLPNCVSWALLQKNHSFLVKSNGVTLTTEPGNVTNIHSSRFSGLANKRAVDIQRAGKDAGVVLALKSRKVSKRRQPANEWNKVTTKKAFRKTSKTIKNQLEGYRSDLVKPALARWT